MSGGLRRRGWEEVADVAWGVRARDSGPAGIRVEGRMPDRTAGGSLAAGERQWWKVEQGGRGGNGEADCEGGVDRTGEGESAFAGMCVG